MKIYKYEVPNEMILQYCKVIKAIEKSHCHNNSYECARSELHNKIFDYVKCHRACVTRDDRNFSIALDRIVFELTFEE